MLFAFRTSGWDRSNVLERNVGTYSNTFSILGLTDVLRRTSTEPRFRIRIYGKSSAGKYGARSFTGSLPVSQSLIVRSSTEAAQADLKVEREGNRYATDSKAAGNYLLPWLPDSGRALLSIGKPQPYSVQWSLINTVNRPYLDSYPYHYVRYYMRE